MTDLIPPQADGLRIPAGDQPSPERQRRMRTAVRAVCDSLQPMGRVEAAVSPLGPEWSSDIDVYVDDIAMAERLARSEGWIGLGPLLRHIGYRSHSFAVTDAGRLLARVDLKEGLPPPLPERVRKRIERLDAPDARAVLEVRMLMEQGLDMPNWSDSILAGLADLEHRYGGSMLSAWRQFAPRNGSAHHSRFDLLKPRVRVAISGIDGSGKSTLVGTLADDLAHCDIPVTIIWTRPGMRLGWLDRAARVLRRARGETLKGIERLAEGADPPSISSRRGLTGWVWLLLVTLSFLVDVHRQTRRVANGVIIYDRHLLDALGTIDVFYEGVDSRVQKFLIRRLLPRADLSVWLNVDAEIASARKPDDLIGMELVRRQYEAYTRHEDAVKYLERIDLGDRESLEPVEVVRTLVERLAVRKPSLRSRLLERIRERRGRPAPDR